MNWFQHDAASTQDAKIKKLLIRHGAIGYAIYFHCLELIIADTSETNITFELEHDSEIIADNLKITGTGDKSGRDIVEEIMRTIIELGLFTNDGGHIFCFKLLKRINLSMTSSPKLREAIAQAKADHHDDIMTRHDEIMSHHATYLPTNQPGIPTKPKRVDKEAACAALPVESFGIAGIMLEMHRKIDPAYSAQITDKDIKRWALDIDKLNRIDGRSWVDIEAALRWAKAPGCFWAPNIISGKKLREKFPTIYGQMKQKPGASPKVNQRTAFLDLEE